jgi:hypothetical protein
VFFFARVHSPHDHNAFATAAPSPFFADWFDIDSIRERPLLLSPAIVAFHIETALANGDQVSSITQVTPFQSSLLF